MRNLLVLDIGNTNTRLAVWEDGRVTRLLSGRTGELHDLADVEAFAQSLAQQAGIELDQARLAVCSVVPTATAVWSDWAQRSGPEPFLITGATQSPLENCYRHPDQLGPDRLAAAVAAARRLGAPVIVASLGTATVVDVVSQEGKFLGGAIAAGAETGLAGLAERAAALPQVTLEAPERLVGDQTEECLRVGAVLGTAALVEGLAARFQRLVGEGAPVALTGGHAQLLSPLLWIEHEVLPNLVLEGTALLWEHHHDAR